MIYIEGFRLERASPSSAHFQFLLKDKYSNDVHAFFEGDDDSSFYINFLSSFSSDTSSIYSYQCNDKKGVYDAHRKVMNSFPKGITLFFVDKDLSDILNENWTKSHNIYITDYYAIENYLVSEAMLSRVWLDLFHFKNVILDFSKVHQKKFRTELNRFYENILPIVAWGIYLRRNGQNPNMKNIRFLDLFEFDDNLTLLKSEKTAKMGDIKLLEQLCGVKTPTSWQTDSEAIFKELSALEPKTYIRGKLELCFFVRFVEKLILVLNKNLSEQGGGVGTHTQMHEQNAVEVLGPRLSVPQSLETFLRENITDQFHNSIQLQKN